MSKLNKCFFVLAAGILYSSAVSARVCFLAGTDDDASCLLSTPAFEATKCLGYESCDIPATGARVCEENEAQFYFPEDCCSNASLYERCDAPGQYCNSTNSCAGTDSEGNDYQACQAGRCACLSSYNKECSASDGYVGDGDACNGKFESCKCDPSKFSVCDASATCSGSCRLDSSMCSSCTCPAADGDEWVQNPSDCCAGSDYSCTNKNGATSGTTVYHCRFLSLPENCTCGYSSTGKCVTGCSDSGYSYKGTKQFVTCDGGFVSFLNDANSICGNNCHCYDGYFDFTHTCTAQNASVCADLGYNSTSCDGDWLACPFDPSAKKCLGITDCKNYPFTTCPSGAVSCSECNDGTGTHYKVNGCELYNGYVPDTTEGCYALCIQAFKTLPLYMFSGEYWTETHQGTTYYCSDGCQSNEDLNGTWDGYYGYDKTTNQCLPATVSECELYNYGYVVLGHSSSISKPSGDVVECKSGEGKYYMCPEVSVNGQTQTLYDSAENKCTTCYNAGFTLTECPDGQCDSCSDEDAWGSYGGPLYRKKCTGYRFNAYRDDLEGAEVCYNGSVKQYTCGTGYTYDTGYCSEDQTDCDDDMCIECKDGEYTLRGDILTYCPSSSCDTCTSKTGQTLYLYTGCESGYFECSANGWLECLSPGEMCVDDTQLTNCKQDCSYTLVDLEQDPNLAGYCPFDDFYPEDRIAKCYKKYDAHTYVNGKKVKCGASGCNGSYY